MIHSRTKRSSKVLFGAVAAVVLSLAATDSAQAGKAELKALNAALGKDINSATADELVAAVKKVLTENSKMAKRPGLVAGEALKAAAIIAGEKGALIADAVFEAVPGGDRITVTADAAVTAGTGKGNNVSQVDEFTSVSATSSEAAIAAAAKAKKSKTGAGAIIEGFASGLTDATAKKEFAIAALNNKALSGAATEVSAGASVGVGSDDPNDDPTEVREFAKGVIAGAPAKLAAKIAPGIVASNSKSAADIVDALYSTNNPVLLKGVSVVAKTVSAAADIEEISNIALVLGRKIGDGAINIKAAAGLAKTLTAAIIAKTTLAAPHRNSLENKADEVAEVAAFIVGGLANSSLTAKTAPKIVLAIIKSAIQGGTVSKKSLKQGAQPLNSDYIRDVAGSVALTLENASLASGVLDEIKGYLEKNVNKIAGKTKGPEILAALNEGYSGSERYENGNIEGVAFVIDAETDDRGFDTIPDNQR